MRHPHSIGIALVLTAACVIAAAAQTGQSKPAPPAKPAAKVVLPPAVDAAFKRAYPNATIKGVSKETVKGQTEYEVESMDGTQARDLVYRPDGTVVYYEELISESAVPAVVVSAIKTRYPKATLSTCEKLFKDGTKDGTMNYEFILKGAAVKEVELTPAGKWVSPAAPAGRGRSRLQ